MELVDLKNMLKIKLDLGQEKINIFGLLRDKEKDLKSVKSECDSKQEFDSRPWNGGK